MRKKKIEAITEPGLIVCEGPQDAAFFRALLSERGIKGFQVVSPQDVLGEGGKDRFAHAFNGLIPIRGFEQIKLTIFVGDNDDDPAASVAAIRDQLTKTEEFGNPPRKLDVPINLLEKTAGVPSVALLMIPWANEPGCLETLCWNVASRVKPDLAPCALELIRCAKIEGWSASKLDKVRLRALMASSYKRNPEISLTFLWDDFPELVPVSDSEFNRISEFLRSCV